MDGEQTSPFILLEYSGIQSCTTILPESKGKMFKNMLTHFELVSQEAMPENCISATRADHGARQDWAPAQAAQQQSLNTPRAIFNLCNAKTTKIALS